MSLSTNSGLTSVLQTGNMTTYPETCARATASFAVLSDSIKMVQEIVLLARQRKDLAGLLGQLQSHEKEKLYLTAAYHLERIRQRNHDFQQPEEQEQQQQQPVTHQGEATTTRGDPRIAKLLSESVTSLQFKIATSVQSINEILEELRCAMLEEEEEEEEEEQ
jgi:hypothetical protein